MKKETENKSIEKEEKAGRARKKRDEVWGSFWKNRRTSFIGSVLFYIRKNFLTKTYVKIGMENSKKGKLLEAGCGTALNSIMIGKERGDEIYAMDFLDAALEEAERYSKMYGYKIKTVKGDIHKIPYKDKEFDLCWNIGTIEHFENPVPIIKEMKRVGKVIIAIVPGKGPIWKNYLKIINLIGPKVEGYVKLYDETELEKEFKKASVKKIKTMTIRILGFPYIAAVGE